MIRLGRRGYRNIMMNLTRTADYLVDALKQMGFIILSDTEGRGLPVVAFRIDPKSNAPYDEFAIAHQLRERGWVVPAYTMAPNSQKMKMMRIVVREDFTKNRCNALLADFKLALGSLEKMDQELVQKYTMYVHSNKSSEFGLLLAHLRFFYFTGTVEERYPSRVASFPKRHSINRMTIPYRVLLASHMAFVRVAVL